MTNLMESIILALIALKSNLMSSILTTIGIIVGVTSVIAVVSILQGFTNRLTQEFENMGSNVIIIKPYAPYSEQLKGNYGRLNVADFRAIERVVDDVELIIPNYSLFGVTLEYKGNKASLMKFYGTTSDYSEVHNHYTTSGRFLIPSDGDYRRKVVVLGSETRIELGLPENYIGEYINIFNQSYKVIGEMEARGSIMGVSRDNEAFIPFEKVGEFLADSSVRQLEIAIKVGDIAQALQLIEQLNFLLRNRHDIALDDVDDFKIETADKIKQQQQDTLKSYTYIVAAVVGISLLVGGIGIMNIMLVSVTERTREIGICKALGAKRSDIMVQFLSEAVILCLLGGIIGVILGYGVGLFISAIIPGIDQIIVPLWAIILSLGLASFIGIIFGLIPAIRAANLDPIQALHYE